MSFTDADCNYCDETDGTNDVKSGSRTASKTIGGAIEWHGNIAHTLVNDPRERVVFGQLIGIVSKVVVDNHGIAAIKLMHSHFFRQLLNNG